MTRSDLGEERACFILHSHVTEGSQDRNLVAEGKAETIEECLLSYTPHYQLPRGGTTHYDIGLPTSVRRQRSACDLYETLFLCEPPFPHLYNVNS